MPRVWRYFLASILLGKATFASADTLEADKYRVFGFDVDYGKTYSVFLSVSDADCDLYGKEGATWPPPSGEAPTKADYWAGYASTNYLTLDESFTFTAVRDDYLWVSIYAVPLNGTCAYDYIDALGHVAVASLTASAVTRDSARVQWGAAFRADHYEYQYGLNGGLFGTVHRTQATYADLTGLTPERNYDFRVRACNVHGDCTAWAHAHEGTGYLFRTLDANRPPRAASDPAPAHMATGQGTWTALTWNGNGDPDGDGVLYKVYFGTDASPDAGEYQGTQSSTVFDPPGDLQRGTTYYWRIDTFDGELTTEGPVWHFTTQANRPPLAASDPAPANMATGQETWTALTWNGNGDPDGDGVLYKVYFGTDSSPDAGEYQGTQSSTVFDPPGTLQPGTRYFWRIDTFDGELTTEGPVWSFFTKATNRPPAPASDPRPADQSIDMPTRIGLAWTGNGDADGDPVQYKVYFGTDSSPDAGEYLGTTTDLQWNLPQALAADTTYYWRIDTFDGELTTQGPVWRFTTGAGPHARMSLTDTLVLESQGDGEVRVAVTDGRQVPYVLYLKSYASLAELRAAPLLAGRVDELPPDQVLLSNGRNQFKELSLGPKPLVALGLDGGDRLPDGYYRIAYAWGRHMVLDLDASLLTGDLYCTSQSMLDFLITLADWKGLSIIDTLGELSREAFDGVAIDLVLQALPEEVTGADFSLISELCDNPDGVAALVNNLLGLPGGEHYAFGQWLDRLLYDLSDQFALTGADRDASEMLTLLALDEMNRTTAAELKVVAYYLALRINTYTDVMRFLWDAWKPPVMGERAFAILGGELYDVDAGSQPQPLAIIHSQITQTEGRVQLTLDASASRIPASNLGVDHTWLLRDALGNTLDSAQGERVTFTFDQGRKLWVTLVLDVFQPDRETSVAVTKVVVPDPLPPFDFDLEAQATDVAGEYRFQVKFLEGMTAEQVQRISYDFGDGTRVTDFAGDQAPLILSQTHRYSTNGDYSVAVTFIAHDGRLGQAGIRVLVETVPDGDGTPPPPDDGTPPPPDDGTNPPPPTGGGGDDGSNPPLPPPDDGTGDDSGGGTDDSPPPPSVDDPNDSRPPPPDGDTGGDSGSPPPPDDGTGGDDSSPPPDGGSGGDDGSPPPDGNTTVPGIMAAPSASDGTWFGRVVIQWPAQGDATQYHLLRCTDATLLSSCRHLGGQEETQYEDGDLTAQERYYYRVYACNGAGCGQPSPPDVGWAAPLPAPETPCLSDEGEVGLLERFSTGTYQCLSRDPLTLAPVVESGAQFELQAPQIHLQGGFRVERGAVVRLRRL